MSEPIPGLVGARVGVFFSNTDLDPLEVIVSDADEVCLLVRRVDAIVTLIIPWTSIQHLVVEP